MHVANNGSDNCLDIPMTFDAKFVDFIFKKYDL